MRTMLNRDKMIQTGIISYGAGLNHLHWIEQAKSKGKIVLLCSGYAAVFSIKQ